MWSPSRPTRRWDRARREPPGPSRRSGRAPRQGRARTLRFAGSRLPAFAHLELDFGAGGELLARTWLLRDHPALLHPGRERFRNLADRAVRALDRTFRRRELLALHLRHDAQRVE